MINGKLTRLRPFESSDLVICKNWINDPEISRSLLRVLPVSTIEHAHWYENIMKDKTKLTFAIDSREKNEYVGNIGLTNIDWRNRNAMFWIYLGKEFWGKGYGKEATSLFLQYTFQNLNLHKISLNIATSNDKAIRIYKSVGFREDGLLVEEVYLDGEYLDIFRMSILRREFLKNETNCHSTTRVSPLVRIL